ALVNPIIEAFRQQRRLLAIRPLNETLHHFPRRFSKRIIAPMGFSHSLDPKRTLDRDSSPVFWSVPATNPTISCCLDDLAMVLRTNWY
ncbi:MAG TPA: hypothetical protein VN957_17985, partial [Chthoniobacterales bacterium]|nr:hypothetical protein [Chthoniobacterales bacterium]